MEGSSGIQCEQSWSLVFLLGRGRILWQSFEEQGSAVHTNWLQTFIPDACIYKQKLYLLFFSFVSISALFVALKVSVILLGTRCEDRWDIPYVQQGHVALLEIPDAFQASQQSFTPSATSKRQNYHQKLLGFVQCIPRPTPELVSSGALSQLPTPALSSSHSFCAISSSLLPWQGFAFLMLWSTPSK